MVDVTSKKDPFVKKPDCLCGQPGLFVEKTEEIVEKYPYNKKNSVQFL